MATQANKPTLLTLPAELREMIYEYAFSEVVDLDLQPYSGPTTPRLRNAGLVLACRTTYSEGLTIYYKNSIFYARGIGKISRWLQQLPASHPPILREIRADVMGASNAASAVLRSERAQKLRANGIKNKAVLKTNFRIKGKKIWSAEYLRST